MLQATPVQAAVVIDHNTPLDKIPGMRDRFLLELRQRNRPVTTLGQLQDLLANSARQRVDGTWELDLSGQIRVTTLESDELEALAVNQPYVSDALKAKGFNPIVNESQPTTPAANSTQQSTLGFLKSAVQGFLH